jgi:hypothetical protein
MNKAEARSILSSELKAFASRSYNQLAALIGNPGVKNFVSESDVNYQIEFSVFWDAKPDENLRIIGSIDDGGWRAFLPLTGSLIMRPDGTLI